MTSTPLKIWVAVSAYPESTDVLLGRDLDSIKSQMVAADVQPDEWDRYLAQVGEAHVPLADADEALVIEHWYGEQEVDEDGSVWFGEGWVAREMEVPA